MASVRTNFPEIRAALDRLGSAFTMNARGRYRDLGSDLLDAAAEAVYEQSTLDQQDPQGRPFAPLAASTLREKARKGFPSTIGVRTGDMLSSEQLRGRRVVTPRVAEMTYGVGDEAEQKSEWFQEGTKNQPARPFYDLNAKAEQSIDQLVDDVIDRTLRDLGG
jgi:hypothetical protein